MQSQVKEEVILFLVQKYIRGLLFSLGRSKHYLSALFNHTINIESNKAALATDRFAKPPPLVTIVQSQLSNCKKADLSSFEFLRMPKQCGCSKSDTQNLKSLESGFFVFFLAKVKGMD